MFLHCFLSLTCFFFFFFNDTATTEIYTLSLHDALPISGLNVAPSKLTLHGNFYYGKALGQHFAHIEQQGNIRGWGADRKSTRLNSSHLVISYAVFCLKKKKKLNRIWRQDEQT